MFVPLRQKPGGSEDSVQFKFERIIGEYISMRRAAILFKMSARYAEYFNDTETRSLHKAVRYKTTDEIRLYCPLALESFASSARAFASGVLKGK